MLSIYVRELSSEHKPVAVPDGAKLVALRIWARKLDACRPDMENAAQTLGRLRGIDGVEATKVPIDLRRANLQGFDLRRVNFDNARLDGAQMQGADLGRAQMQGTDLGGAQMQGAIFFGAEMQRADLSWTKMQGAELRKAKMQRAYLFRAEMWGADLSWAKMQGANLIGAELLGADLFGAEMNSATSLTGAYFHAASLREVDYTDVNISQAQVDDLFYDGSVTFAPDVKRAAGREEILDRQKFYDQWSALKEKSRFVGE
jgi:uncharacterized protein YjbI with pentapeptide repeats